MKSERQAAEMSSLAQGIALLDAVVRQERSGRSGFSVSTLSETTGIERSRVSRLTQELLDLGMLVKHVDGRFRVGSNYFSLGASRQDAWLRGSRRELRRLASHYRASARIYAADGPRAVLLRFETGSGSPHAAIMPGMVTPVWSTGGGRALLWDSPEDELRALLAESRFVGVGGPRAAKSVAEVIQRISVDRERGFVEAIDEFEYGVTEIASPVRLRERVVAAVSVACHSDDFAAHRALGFDVRSVARQLERWAGVTPDPAD